MLGRRHRRLTAVLPLVLATLAGCTGSSMDPNRADSAGQELPIGLIVPKSGVYKAVGDDLGAGFRLYLSTHNNRLGGRPIKVIEADEGSSVAAARTAGKKLLDDDRVVAIVGGASAETTAALNPLVTGAGVPFVGTGGRPSSITDPAWLWHTSWMSDETGAAIADYLRTTVNGPVFAIGPDYTGGWDQVGGFVRAYTVGGGKLANPGGTPLWTPFPPTSKNFSADLAQIKPSGAKAVYCFYAGEQATQFVTQYKQFGIGLPLYGAGFLTEGAALLQAQGDSALGVYTVLNYSSTLDNPANREFVRTFQAANAGASPTVYHVTGWDAGLVLDKAITEALAYPSPTTAATSPSSPMPSADATASATAGASGTASAAAPRGTTVGGVNSVQLNAAMRRIGAIDSPRGPWQFGTLHHTPVQRWYLRQVVLDGKSPDGKGVLTNRVVQDLATLGA